MIILTAQIKDIDRLIEDRFYRHPSAELITSLPGIGVLLGAEFITATGGDMDRFGSADAWPASPESHPWPATPAA